MKVSLLLVVVLVVAPVIGSRHHEGSKHSWRKNHHFLFLEDKQPYIHERVHRHHLTPSRLENNACETCISFAQQTIQQLLDIILEGGIVGGCSKLCQALQNRTKIPFVEAACDVICTAVGIKTFVNFIKKADLNPIYFCELAKFCPVNDYGDAKINSFIVSPKSGPQGLFTFTLLYTSNNGTGTGEFTFNVKTLDGVLWGGNFLHLAAPAGKYSRSFELKAVPDPSCDPSKQACEQWIPGQYDVKLAFCYGICGSTRPHSATYDTAMTNFTITANNTVLWPLP